MTMVPLARTRQLSLLDHPFQDPASSRARLSAPTLIRPLRLARLGGIDRLALGQVAGLQTSAEPTYFLLRGTVSPVPAAGHRAGVHVAVGVEPEAIITDCRQQPEHRFHVARFEDVPGLIGVVGPDSGEEIRLKLEANPQPFLLVLAQPRLASPLLLGNPQELLDMMSNLVGDDVGAGEVTRCVEPLLQLLEEA